MLALLSTPSMPSILQVTGSYICAMERPSTPSIVALSRQSCPHLEGTSVEAVAKGAYTLCEHGPGDVPAIVLVGTGRPPRSEVAYLKWRTVGGRSRWRNRGRCISMPPRRLCDPCDARLSCCTFRMSHTVFVIITVLCLPCCDYRAPGPLGRPVSLVTP